MIKLFAVGMVCLLVLSLVGCYEYRGPYTTADVEERLTGKYPDKTIHIQQKGVQSWECWFDEVPDAFSFFGYALVIAASFVMFLYNRSREKQAQAKS